MSIYVQDGAVVCSEGDFHVTVGTNASYTEWALKKHAKEAPTHVAPGDPVEAGALDSYAIWKHQSPDKS